jgi:GntR family transcriptional regulator
MTALPQSRTVGQDAGNAPDGSLLAVQPRVPKYYRLKSDLIEMIGSLPAGSPVPPERTLSNRFSMSRTTVRQALQELVLEGRLMRAQGRGTFVAQPKVAQALQLTSYTEDMLAKGLEPTSQLLEIGYLASDDALAERLAIRPGSRALRIERLRMANGAPMAVETTHLGAKRFPGLRKRLADGHGGARSLYTVLAENYGVVLAGGEETIETVPAGPRDAALLGTEVGLPLLLLCRHSWDDGGTPVEWVRSMYRGDRYKFVAQLQRPNQG